MSTYSPEDRTDHPEVATNPIEANVPNSAKTLPTSKRTVTLLSFAAGIAAIAAIIVDQAMGMEVFALVLAVAAVAAGGIATVMALGDARAKALTPGIITVISAIIAVIALLDVMDVEDTIDADPAAAITAPAGGEGTAAP